MTPAPGRRNAELLKVRNWRAGSDWQVHRASGSSLPPVRDRPCRRFGLAESHSRAGRGAVPDAEGRGSQNASCNLPQGRACSSVVTHRVVLSAIGYSGNIYSAWGKSV